MIARLAKARDDLAANETRRHELALAVEEGDAEARREAAALAKSSDRLNERISRTCCTLSSRRSARDGRAAGGGRPCETRRGREGPRISTRLAARGAALDAALDQVRQGYADFQADLRELAMLGAPAPSANLIEVNSRRTLDAALGGLHSKMRPVPPLQRHSFDELCRGWARPSERWAAEILDAPTSVIRVNKEVAA